MEDTVQDCIEELEKSFQSVLRFMKSHVPNNKTNALLRKKTEAAVNALNSLKTIGEDCKDEFDIDEFDEDDFDKINKDDDIKSEDDWGDNDDFDEMIKACEETEQSFNSCDEHSESVNDNSDNEEDANSDEESIIVKQTDKEIYDCVPPTDKHFRVLKQFFGHATFRPMQWKIIYTVLIEKKDVSAVMATGYGKSLCYQYPAIFADKPVIVISPLISLMEDQVMALNVANINACFLGSSQTQKSKVTQEILSGFHKVIYITPEFAENAQSLLQNLDKKIGIGLIAIDEAHCVSHWGHDFRASYRKLGSLRTSFSHVPFMALTATATPAVLNDICSSLKLFRPIRICSSFDRPNLYLEVCLKSNSIENDLLRIMTRKKSKLEFSGPTIIYCPTRNATETVYRVLLDLNITCQIYHAGMKPEDRKKSHRYFVHDKVQVVVATVAFGMGIDKPDVRRVIHYGAPKDIESYYQEIGRAGRDGSPSFCQVFYSNADFTLSKFFLKDISNEKFLRHRSDMINKMQQYLNSTHCRRQMLLSHFQGEDVKNVGGTEKCCDNCKKKVKRNRQSTQIPGSLQDDNSYKRDFANEAKLLFEAIESTNGAYGLAIPIYILRGSSNVKVKESMRKLSIYGKGKYKSDVWWKAFGRVLMCENFLQEVGFKSCGSKKFAPMVGCTISCSHKAKTWLEMAKKDSSIKLMVEMSAEMINLEEASASKKMAISYAAPAPMKRILAIRNARGALDEDLDSAIEPKIEADESIHEQMDPREQELMAKLYHKLIALRNDIADKGGLAPYMVFSNKNLLDIAKYRPLSTATLSLIEGVLSARVAKFGKDIIQSVTAFCQENSFEGDAFPEKLETNPFIQEDVPKDVSLLKKLNASAQESYIMFGKEKSVDGVAIRRGLAATTVLGHLIEAMKVGLPIQPHQLGVNDEMFRTITNVIRAPPINGDITRLTPIKQNCPDFIEFNHIKIVIIALQRKYGVNEIPVLSSEDEKSQILSSKPVLAVKVEDKEEPTNDKDRISSKCETELFSVPCKRKENNSVTHPTEAPSLKKIKSNKLFNL